jgi:hypothetical protein
MAELYGVNIGVLNQAVKRNEDRFPSDFMFQLTARRIVKLEVTNCDLKFEITNCDFKAGSWRKT